MSRYQQIKTWELNILEIAFITQMGHYEFIVILFGLTNASSTFKAATRDGHFQVLEKINDDAYKIDFPGEYSVFATFNVVELSLFDVDVDSKMNHFEEGMNDVSSHGNIMEALEEEVHVPK